MPRGTSEIPRSLKREWRTLAVKMKRQHWTFEHGGRHPKAFAPDGITWTTLSGTSSDQAGWRNARAAFRRWCRDNGLDAGI